MSNLWCWCQFNLSKHCHGQIFSSFTIWRKAIQKQVKVLWMTKSHYLLSDLSWEPPAAYLKSEWCGCSRPVWQQVCRRNSSTLVPPGGRIGPQYLWPQGSMVEVLACCFYSKFCIQFAVSQRSKPPCQWHPFWKGKNPSHVITPWGEECRLKPAKSWYCAISYLNCI